MADRELLEAAAKAAGLKIIRSRLDDPVHGDFLMAGAGERNPGQKAYPWNPLADDGDALRLAIRLRISLVHEQEYMGGPVMETIEAITPPRADESRICETMSLNFEADDEMANTRRAIVRAAAAIGRSYEGEGK